MAVPRLEIIRDEKGRYTISCGKWVVIVQKVKNKYDIDVYYENIDDPENRGASLVYTESVKTLKEALVKAGFLLGRYSR